MTRCNYCEELPDDCLCRKADERVVELAKLPALQLAAEVEAVHAKLADSRAREETLRSELTRAVKRDEKSRRDLAAYKQAKAENDERFMLERDTARQERDAAVAERDAAIAERDARPNITHDDARCLVAWIDDRDSMMSRDVRRATEALVELGTHAKGGE
jgi:uncharacterized protein (DUF3084 family)